MDIINRYENIIDDDLDIIDIYNYEDDKVLVDSISFIKNDNKQKSLENKRIMLFQEVFQMTCVKCDFEDIFRLLS